MTVETWYRIWCDNCNTVNWVCDGNVDDITQSDILGFICYQCKESHYFCDDEYDDDLESYGVGLKEPDYG